MRNRLRVFAMICLLPALSAYAASSHATVQAPASRPAAVAIASLCSDYEGKSCSTNGKQFTCNLSNGTQHKCYCEDSKWNCHEEDPGTSVEPNF